MSTRKTSVELNEELLSAVYLMDESALARMSLEPVRQRIA